MQNTIQQAKFDFHQLPAARFVPVLTVCLGAAFKAASSVRSKWKYRTGVCPGPLTLERLVKGVMMRRSSPQTM